MNTISIVPATPEHVEQLTEFNCRMALETEQLELDPDTVRRGVGRLIAQPANGQYRLAERAGNVVGSLMLTYEWSDWRDGNMWWIQSVYVPPEHRRTGVFSELYNHVIELARQDPDVRCVRLYVEHENHNAQSTYTALGMVETGYRLYEVGV